MNQIYDLLDKQGLDAIDPQTLIAHFDANRHPEVLSKVRSADAVRKEFLDTFDVGGVQPGKITREEFVRYYTNISAGVNDDDYFELTLRNVWHIAENASTSSSVANKLRQAQQLDAVAARRPNSASGLRFLLC